MYASATFENKREFDFSFQSALRQAVYLAIKELATTAEDVIMVTSSIMKDMQPNSEVIYRPNAIRALCRIIDVSFTLASCCLLFLTRCKALNGSRSRAFLQSCYRRP